ncbi:MAG: PEP-CTERM sorting domain-containing protein [Betaproteobacteria bacterium]|nr:PEP-CTERM sorting domain-containing protein [Betaproteobacteria bacterium]
MKLSSLARPALLASALFAVSVAASAATVTITNTTPNWATPVGGTNHSEGWNGQYYDVRWGNGTAWDWDTWSYPNSGLGFNPTNTPFTQNTGTAFVLGQLRHYNNPISGGTAASSVDLHINSTITGASPATQGFDYRFLIDETTNQRPCAYPSTTPCADRITFQNLDLTSSFLMGGIYYTIEMLGFGSNTSNLLTYFDSQEGGTNTTNLWARVTAVPSQVPEPATLALVGLALAGIGVQRKRAAKK